MVTNIGFGLDATHTKADSNYSNLPASDIKFPLIHPEIICTNRYADKLTARDAFTYSIFKKFIDKIKIYKDYLVRNNSN